MPREGISTSDYRRCARRLRHIHRHQPARLARSLCDLSHACDAVSAGRGAAGHAPGPALGAGRQFLQRVAVALADSPLRYSQRLELLREARRHGIGRFDANLIIAAAQDRARQREPVPRPPGRPATPHGSWTACALLAAMLQTLILAGAGYILFP